MLLCALCAFACAWRSPVCVITVDRRELVDELAHTHAALDGGIVLKGQLRGSLHSQLAREAGLKEAVRRLEPRERGRSLAVGAEDADVDGRVAEVGCRVD